MNGAVDDFSNAMVRAGIGDGRIHRLPGEGDKSDRCNAWYVLHADGRPAGAFSSWRTGPSGTWVAGGDGVWPVDRCDLGGAPIQSAQSLEAFAFPGECRGGKGPYRWR